MLAVNRTLQEANAKILHEILMHRSAEKIFRTLENTHGFKPVRLPEYFCEWCAQAATKLGLNIFGHFTLLFSA